MSNPVIHDMTGQSPLITPVVIIDGRDMSNLGMLIFYEDLEGDELRVRAENAMKPEAVRKHFGIDEDAVPHLLFQTLSFVIVADHDLTQ